jgi:AraC-like DNA-binding protein
MLTIVLVLMLVSFMLLFYNQARRQLIEFYKETDLQLLAQLQTNVSMIDNSIENALISAYFDKDISAAYYSTTQDVIVFTKAQDTLRQLLIAPNDYVLGVHLYIKNLDYTISMGNLFYSGEEIDLFKEYLPVANKLEPIIISDLLKESKNLIDKEYITYLMFGEASAKESPGIIVVQINPDWILSNLYSFDSSSESDNDRFFLFYQNSVIGQNSTSTQDILFAQLILEQIELIKTQDPTSVIARIDGDLYLVSTAMVPDTAFRFARVRPYEQVLVVSKKLQGLFLFVILAAVLLSIFTAYIAGKVIYKPLRSVIDEAQEIMPNLMSMESDEISFLHAVNESTAIMLKRLRNKEEQNSTIHTSYLLRNLLFEGSYIPILDSGSEATININLNQEITILILRFMQTGFDGIETKDIVAQAENITFEKKLRAILTELRFELLKVGNNQIILLLNSEEYTRRKDYFHNNLSMITLKGKDSILKRFVIAVSDGSDFYTTLPEAYRLTYEMTEYSFQYGPEIVLTQELISPNLENDSMEVDPQHLENLKEAISAGKLKDIDSALDDLVVEIRQMQAGIVRMVLISILLQIRMVLQNHYIVLTPMIREQFDLLSRSLYQTDFLSTFIFNLKSCLKDLLQSPDSLNKINPLVRATYEIIHNEYCDTGLYIPEIANRLNISAKHLGHLFREEQGLSIPEYLNDYRMEQASKLLLEENILVSEVMLKVGIENESHFYRSFKRCFGMTPRKYILKNCVLTYRIPKKV